MRDDQSFRAAVKEGVLAEKSGRLHDDAAAEAIFEKFGASPKSRRRKK